MGKVRLFDTEIGHEIEVDEATAAFLQDSPRFQVPGAVDPNAPTPEVGVATPVALPPSTDPSGPPAVPADLAGVPVDPALNEVVEQRA